MFGFVFVFSSENVSTQKRETWLPMEQGANCFLLEWNPLQTSLYRKLKKSKNLSRLLTPLALKTNTYSFANSVDPDEMVHNEQQTM